MTIRKLSKNDANVFRAMRVEMCERHPEAFGQTPEEVLKMSDEKFLDWFAPSDTFPEKFVAGMFDGSTLIGTAGFRREESIKERHFGFIWTVYLRSEYRGKGLSKQIMQWVIDRCREMDGLEMVVLTVAATQVNARALYRRLGFVQVGKIPQGYHLPDGRYIDNEEMMLQL
jgi:ribosomal protein S18 acetylase RimI-like enzyme